jgi:hypothetical protein
LGRTHKSFCCHRFYTVGFTSGYKVAVLRDKNYSVSSLAVWNESCNDPPILVLHITRREKAEIMKRRRPPVSWQLTHCPQIPSAYHSKVIPLPFLSLDFASNCLWEDEEVGGQEMIYKIIKLDKGRSIESDNSVTGLRNRY